MRFIFAIDFDLSDVVGFRHDNRKNNSRKNVEGSNGNRKLLTHGEYKLKLLFLAQEQY